MHASAVLSFMCVMEKMYQIQGALIKAFEDFRKRLLTSTSVRKLAATLRTVEGSTADHLKFFLYFGSYLPEESKLGSTPSEDVDSYRTIEVVHHPPDYQLLDDTKTILKSIQINPNLRIQDDVIKGEISRMEADMELIRMELQSAVQAFNQQRVSSGHTTES